MARRTTDDLRGDLEKQMKLLKLSCDSFDSGNEEEALRIAATLRLLLHDTGKSHSLLSQLGVKDNMQFVDSALPLDPQAVVKDGRHIMVLHGLPGLVAITPTNTGWRYVAPLGVREYAKGDVSFQEWWETPCVPGPDKRYTRKQLILQMANKEGGVHIDAKINEAYRALQESSIGTVQANGIVGYTNSVVDASMRQIAWELQQTTTKAEAELAAP